MLNNDAVLALIYGIADALAEEHDEFKEFKKFAERKERKPRKKRSLSTQKGITVPNLCWTF